MARAKFIDINLNREIPADIVKWQKLEKTMSSIFNTFWAWEEKNAELINKFLDQPFFNWEESLFEKLIETNANIKFDHIKDEWINLALLRYNNQMRDFKDCMNKVSPEIKQAYIEEIYDRVQNEIGTSGLYSDFSTECSKPTWWDPLVYFQKVVSYLTWKEWTSWAKKTVSILEKITITNENLNSRLTTPITSDTLLSAIPESIKNSFDALLAFEIGKEADRMINISNDIANKLWWLFSNTFPAINTIIGENAEYKFDENRLWNEYKSKLQALLDDNNIKEKEKEKQINELKWEYYLKYLKSKNSKIGEALEELYNNNFDYSKLSPAVLKGYLNKMAKLRLDKLCDEWIENTLKINFWNYDEFSDFYKKLADPSLSTVHLTNIKEPGSFPSTKSIDIPIHKTIVWWENAWLKDINEYWNNWKSYDYLPIRYEINKSDIDTLDITVEDKIMLLNFLSRFSDSGDKYVIQWADAWMLLYLFFVMNNEAPLSEFNSDEQKKIENLFWKAQKSEKWKNNKNTDGNDEWEEKWKDDEWEKDNKEENEEPLNAESFKNKIEALWPGKFESWSEIWLPMWDSEIPGWWYQWMKVKISNIDMRKWKFTGKVFWWELKFNSNLEWKSKRFDMNQKFLDDLWKFTKDKDKIWLLPDPDKANFNTFMDSLNHKLWTSDLNFPVSWVKWTGDKFMHKVVDEEWNEKDEEIKYFWSANDDKSTYKIKYNPIKHSFTVSSIFNGEEKWKDWKSEKKRFSYKRDMDWNNFLIFFTQKWLVPQTEDESKDAISRQEQDFKVVNSSNRKLKWFSINNLLHGSKAIFWYFKKKLDDYNKEKDAECQDVLEDLILWAMWKVPGYIGRAAWERQLEKYNERNNAARQEIEKYLKIYQADPDFATTFDKVPPFAKNLFWWKSYQKFLFDLCKSKTRSKSDVRKAAALLLANIEKWKSPYRGLVGWQNKWYWVKTLLGEWHYRQFLRDKQRCLNAIEHAWKDKAQLQDILATGEMDYIINNVTWNPDPEYFGSKEQRWIGGDKATEYIDNPSKSLLSDQFANKLDSLNKWWYTASSVDEEFNKMKHNDFNLAKKVFDKNIKSARYQAATASLKKMFTLACNDNQILVYKRCFLIYLLSGAIDINCRKDLGKQAYWWWKSLWFPPALLAKNKWHPEQVVAILDHFSRWNPSNKFSNKVQSYFHKSSTLKWNTNVEQLISDFDSRWKSNNNAEKFCEYLKWDFLITENFETWDSWTDKVLKDLQEKAKDQSNESGDSSLFSNPTCINDAWILASPDTVHNRMITTSEWDFGWETWDEKEDRAKFFEKCSNEINGMTVSQEYTNLLMSKFLWWFWLTSPETKSEIYKWISTASYYKRKISEHWNVFHPAEYANIKIKWESDYRRLEVPLWKITNEDVTKILRYGLEWKAWLRQKHSQQIPEALRKCFDAFQNYFQKAFDAWYLNSPSIKNEIFKISNTAIEQHYRLWWWDVYRKIKKKDNDPLTVVWEESISGSDFGTLGDKEQKSLWRPIFSRDNYLNDDMSAMEWQFKRNWCNVPKLTWDLNENDNEEQQHEHRNIATWT